MEIGKIVFTKIEDEMKRSYLDYAMSVIVARALPDVKDGLKPVHRKILFAMQELGLSHTSPYKKSARIVGETMGKYHPHGDQAIYETLVRMAQDFSLRYPLVDGQGNFGSVDGDPPAAMRYTEARLKKIALEMLSDLDKETVDFVPNFDGSHTMPVVLPAKIPNLLVNGTSGIAVGMATNIPPHNLSEVIQAAIYLIDNLKIENQAPDEVGKRDSFDPLKVKIDSDLLGGKLLEFIKGPDFPTGGEIFDAQAIAQVYTTGRGGIVMRAKAKIEEAKEGRFRIVISEIPYQVNKAYLIQKIAALVKDKKIDGVKDLRDESDRRGMQIVIDLTRDAKPKNLLNRLFKYTQMQSTFNVNMVALLNGEPKLFNLKQLLLEFIRHRHLIVVRRSLFELKKAKERAHILEGLKIALDNLDEVIATIRKSPDASQAQQNLMRKFGLTEIQAQAILDMQLRRLAALERQKIEDEYRQVLAFIKKVQAILKNPHEIFKIVKVELLEINEKYGDSRKTKVFKSKVGEFSEEDLIPNEPTLISVTESGYIKRLPPNTYHAQRRGGKGIIGMTTKEEDWVSEIKLANAHDDVFFFTSKGKVFKLKVYDLPETSRTAKGQAIINLIEIEQNEKVSAFLTLSKNDQPKFLFMTTKKGVVKKTKLVDFENIRKTGIIAINLDSDDELVWVKPTSGQNAIILVTKNGLSVKFDEKDVRETGRASRGVRGIKLGKDNVVVGMDVILRPDDFLLTITEKGSGKKTLLKKHRLQNRGGVGIRALKVSKKTGQVVTSRIIIPGIKDILIISEQGQVIRLPLIQIPSLGRDTQGVRLMRLGKDDKVSSIACFETEVE